MTNESIRTSPAEGKKRGPRNLRPLLSVSRESPISGATYELRESTQDLVKSYARFLSKHEDFEVSPSTVVESVLKNFLQGDEAFQEYLKTETKTKRAGAKAKGSA